MTFASQKVTLSPGFRGWTNSAPYQYTLGKAAGWTKETNSIVSTADMGCAMWFLYRHHFLHSWNQKSIQNVRAGKSNENMILEIVMGM